MQLKYLRSVLSPEESNVGIIKVAWSNSNLKLALATDENVILLFDDMGIRRDKFSLKPVNIKYGKKSFTVTGLAFSPDSLKIAVGQSDGVIFVYKIGIEWGEKKSICNKFIQECPVTCLHWLFEGPLIYGLLDGRVRSSNIKSNRTKTLYDTNSSVVSLAGNNQGTGFLSGHMDGTIIRFYVKFDQKPERQGQVVRFTSPPYALAWANDFIMTSGALPMVLIFKNTGELYKMYDYTDEDMSDVFFVAQASPSGQCVVFGCYNGLRCYSWKPRKEDWEEDNIKRIEGLSEITCLAWKEDGSRLAVGTSSGACDIFESALRRMIFKKKIEVSHIGPSHISIKSLMPGGNGVVFNSLTGGEIEDVRVMGDDDQYVVARTAETLILVNLEQQLLSEVPWPPSTPEERFIFRYPSVCLIYRPTELTIVEYGSNETLMTIGTELVTPPLISVRINERRPMKEFENKRLAYMMDVVTVRIVDLVNCTTIAMHQHHTRIDWLDLNETGGKLLFQDRKKVVFLLDADFNSCIPLLNQCTFVQWVEGSNAVIAQSRNTLHVWYNINSSETINCYNVTGSVIDVIRDKNKICVVTEEADHHFFLDLNVLRLDFETAIGDRNLHEAYAILSKSSVDADMIYMWNVLAKEAVRNFNFYIAKECYGRLGDMAHVHFVNKLLALARINRHPADGVPDSVTLAKGRSLFSIQAAIFEHNIEAAVEVYVKKHCIQEALDLLTHYRLWDEAYDLASRLGYINVEDFREKYISHLLATKQFRRAAELKESQGQLVSAFFYYVRGGSPAMAAKIMIQKKELLNDKELTEIILDTLKKKKNYEIAGQIYEELNEKELAFQMYSAGSAFAKAIELARKLSPTEVVLLEEKWGDHLMSHQQQEAAINHYIEAGLLLKALGAAIIAYQWKKAAEIIQNVQDVDSVVPAIRKTAQYFASVKDYNLAEDLYAKAGLWEEALDMYFHAHEWKRVKAMARKYRDNDRLIDLYTDRAVKLSDEGILDQAELLFMAIKDHDAAISMYKRNRRYNDMIRIVEKYHPNLVMKTHFHLGQELESEGRFTEAKHHFLAIDDFNSVIKMYQSLGKWEEAYEIARKYCSPEVANRVIYLWAKESQGKAAVKLLKKFDAVESAIQFACDDFEFEFAFFVATTLLPSKVPDLHFKYAMALEDDGKFKEAEDQFIKANRPKEAVLMYMHCQDWTSALRVTEIYDPDSRSEVLISQAKAAFEKERYNFFERLLLRASQPELIVRTYKEAGMWKEALRVCNDYLSSAQLAALQDEYDELFATSAADKDGVEGLFMKAQEFERRKQYEEAIECYLLVDESITDDINLLLKAWKTAAELTSRYLDERKCTEVAKVLGPKLWKVNQPKLAVQIYLSGSMLKEAIDIYIAIGDWRRAKKLADEIDVSYVPYVEKLYSENMMHGGIKKVKENKEAEKQIRAQLDELIQQNEWEKCLELAEEQKIDFFDQYLARYAMHLVKIESPHEALDLLLKYGAPASETLFYVYKRMINGLMYAIRWSTHGAYREWASLRTLLLRLVENLRSPSSDAGVDSFYEFERLLLIVHFFAAREAYRLEPSLQLLMAKLSSAMVRYIDVIPADRAFFEAGVDNRACGLEPEAFFFLNYYLDICDAIKDRSWENFEESYLKYTDVPTEIPLPQKLFVNDFMHEEVKDWVLTQSVDKTLNVARFLDDRRLFPSALRPRHDDVEEEDEGDEIMKEPIPGRDPCPPCLLSGYPILSHHGEKPIKLRKRGMFIIPEEWELAIETAKQDPSSKVNDVLAFISEWCGGLVD
ncbi:intraflagellar transport protein 172 homolog [Anabrus simplex]|uniref:intraflagellar transport protein 172 homolog n=1 Tax=Anabrus simplex TaxID=316456 RepID=UPI0035A2F4CD